MIQDINTIDSWEFGTCWVKSPITDEITIHESRRCNKNGNVQFYIENEYHKEGGYWIDFGKGWWDNFTLQKK